MDVIKDALGIVKNNDIKTFRNNFSKIEGVEFMGDNYFIGLKWFNQVVGITIRIKQLKNKENDK